MAGEGSKSDAVNQDTDAWINSHTIPLLIVPMGLCGLVWSGSVLLQSAHHPLPPSLPFLQPYSLGDISNCELWSLESTAEQGNLRECACASSANNIPLWSQREYLLLCAAVTKYREVNGPHMTWCPADCHHSCVSLMKYILYIYIYIVYIGLI